MQNGDTINPEVLAIEPRPTNSEIEKRGQQMLLQRGAGLSNREIAVIHGISEETVEGLILAAVDDNLLAGIESEMLDRLIYRSDTLDRKLDEMFNSLENWQVRNFQRIDGFGEKHNLTEDYSNVADKNNIIKERRQLIVVQKALLTAKGKGGKRTSGGETGMRLIADTLGASILTAFDRVAQEARERGALEARLEGESPVTEDRTIYDTVTVIEATEGDDALETKSEGSADVSRSQSLADRLGEGPLTPEEVEDGDLD